MNQSTISHDGKFYTADEFYQLAVQCEFEKGRHQAIHLFQQIVEHAPGHARALNSLGACHHLMGRVDMAIPYYERAITANPRFVEAINNLGIARMAQGDMSEAERLYKKALTVKPDYGKALHNLSTVRRYLTTDDPDFKRIEAAFYSPNIKDDEKCRICFALGKIYDDCQLYDQAFYYFKMGNELKRQTVPYDADRITKSVTDIIQAFPPGQLKGNAAQHVSAERQPLFIVGMPRSGTTLLSVMLARHADISSAGEVSLLAGEIGFIPSCKERGFIYPKDVNQLSRELFQTIAERYLMSLEQRSAATTQGYIIDKHPLNFLHLGMIRQLFPKAPVIHITRDPMDTALSNYFQLFGNSYSYSFDFKSIAHFYGQYRRLMSHWRAMLPSSYIEVSYEDLVQRPEPTVRGIIEELGLPWDEDCLLPHKSTGDIHTASIYQARQPVYKDSLQKWKLYRKHLGDLREVMEAMA